MVTESLNSRALAWHARAFCSIPRNTHTCTRGVGERGLERRAWEGKEISSDSRKMFRDLHKGTAVMFSPSVLVVSLENAIKIF